MVAQSITPCTINYTLYQGNTVIYLLKQTDQMLLFYQ